MGRPDPDELLQRVTASEAEAHRGRLTIFFGAAPGVGKTYTMLEAARTELTDGARDLVVGIVETHGRYDTGALVMGLELVPRRQVVHRGMQLDEMDLDAILARRPALVLVDELAHTNAPGSRHTKRWQDVDELLASGIDVFTTLNVQHLESLKDVVAQITGVVVRESVPDAVFDRAYEVRVVDLPVDELLERLAEGKIYVAESARNAIANFFQEGNLIALRELALRRTAERVEAKMRHYKATHGITEAWHTGERVLVCVSPAPSAARLVRTARRMATSLHAELIALYVETPASLRLGAAGRARLAANLRLAESLGAEAVTVRGESAALETVTYARRRNATKIVVGKPTHAPWRDLVRPSFLDTLVRSSAEIDIHVTSGAGEADRLPAVRAPRPPGRGYLLAVLAVALATLVAWTLFGRAELADIVMVYLLGVVLVAMRHGSGASIFAAALSVVAVDVVFIPPYFSLAVTDFRHVTTFAVMFVVAVVIGQLTKRTQEQADAARRREARTMSLFALSRELGRAGSVRAHLATAARHLRETFGVEAAIFLAGPDGKPRAAHGTLNEKDTAVVEWVWVHQRPAGAGTDTLPAASALVVPLRGSGGRVGVLALVPGQDARLDDRVLLDTFAGLIGSTLERMELAAAVKERAENPVDAG